MDRKMTVLLDYFAQKPEEICQFAKVSKETTASIFKVEHRHIATKIHSVTYYNSIIHNYHYKNLIPHPTDG